MTNSDDINALSQMEDLWHETGKQYADSLSAIIEEQRRLNEREAERLKPTILDRMVEAQREKQASVTQREE